MGWRDDGAVLALGLEWMQQRRCASIENCSVLMAAPLEAGGPVQRKRRSCQQEVAGLARVAEQAPDDGMSLLLEELESLLC
jgi:hypothetical protein